MALLETPEQGHQGGEPRSTGHEDRLTPVRGIIETMSQRSEDREDGSDRQVREHGRPPPPYLIEQSEQPPGAPHHSQGSPQKGVIARAHPQHDELTRPPGSEILDLKVEQEGPGCDRILFHDSGADIFHEPPGQWGASSGIWRMVQWPG